MLAGQQRIIVRDLQHGLGLFTEIIGGGLTGVEHWLLKAKVLHEDWDARDLLFTWNVLGVLGYQQERLEQVQMDRLLIFHVRCCGG